MSGLRLDVQIDRLRYLVSQVGKRLFGLLDLPSEIRRVDRSDFPALGTGEVRTSLQPGDVLHGLMAALLTGNHEHVHVQESRQLSSRG